MNVTTSEWGNEEEDHPLYMNEITPMDVRTEDVSAPTQSWRSIEGSSNFKNDKSIVCFNDDCQNRSQMKYCAPCYQEYTQQHRNDNSGVLICLNVNCENETKHKYCVSCNTQHKKTLRNEQPKYVVCFNEDCSNESTMKYCVSCYEEYTSQPRPCITCHETSTSGRYCMYCRNSYQERLRCCSGYNCDRRTVRKFCRDCYANLVECGTKGCTRKTNHELCSTCHYGQRL